MLEMQRPATIPVDDAKPAAFVPMPVPKLISWKAAFLILLAACLANAAIVLVGLPKVGSDLAPTYSTNFGDLYDLIAKNLDQGYGYRVKAAMGDTMLREPGYPLLLAVVFKVGGYGIQQARFACVLLAFGSALLLFRLTQQITRDAGTALAASLLFLLYPGVLVAEARAGVEIPSTFTLLIFMVVLHGAVEKGSLWRFWTAGLALGAAVMVRSEALLFPSFLTIYFLFAARNLVEGRKVVERMAVLALGAVVVMSPWIIRNYLLVHEFVPTATVVGIAAQEGLFTCESAGPAEPFVEAQTRAGFERAEFAGKLGMPFVGPYYQLFYTPHDEVAFNHALLSRVSNEYRHNPALLAKCAAKNVFFNLWFLGKRPQSTLLNVIVQAPLLGLALGGVVVLWRGGLLGKAAIILLYILYVPVVHAPIIAHARHSTLIVPFLAIPAAVFLVSAWRTLRVGTIIGPRRVEL